MNLFFIISIFITGLSGIIAEILLIRELLVIFEGNELSLGIIIANWLIVQAIGSYVIGKKFEYSKQKILNFILLQFLFSISFFLSLWLTRTIKYILKIPFGIALGVDTIFLTTIMILFFPGCIHGILFTLSAKILQEKIKDKLIGISKTYIYEIGGTIFGGIVSTYLLIQTFNSFQIANLVLFLNLICCILIFIYYDIKNKKTLILTNIFFLIFIIIFSFNLVDKLEKTSLQILWQKQNVLYNKNSIYNNIVVVEQNKQYNFFINSNPILSIPHIDKLFAEEIVHIPASLIDNLKKVLIINKGVGGVIFEFLKYKNITIDYLEIDPEIIKVIQKFSNEIVNEELSNSNVNYYYKDAIYFVKNTKNIYDIIIFGFIEPKDLKSNRFFTYEFFKILRNKISKKGVLVVQTSGSQVYLSNEMLKFNKSIIYTLKEVFKYVYVIVGDYNIILCSDENFIYNLNTEKIISILKKRNIKLDLLSNNYLSYRLNKQKTNWFYNQLKNISIKLNYDFLPSVVKYTLQYWTLKVSPSIYSILYKKTKFLVYIIIIVITLMFILNVKSKPFINIEITTTTSCFSVGCVSMLLYIVILFSFQVLYGYIYYQIGLFTSFFLLGSVVGTKFANKHINKINLLNLESFVLFVSILIFLIIKIIKYFSFDTNKILYNFFPYIFLTLSLISGMLSGVGFPVFNKILLDNSSKNISSVVGKIYAADLFGGWVGAVFGSVVIFPNFGLNGVFITILILKIFSLSLIISSYIYERKKNRRYL